MLVAVFLLSERSDRGKKGARRESAADDSGRRGASHQPGFFSGSWFQRKSQQGGASSIGGARASRIFEVLAQQARGPAKTRASLDSGKQTLGPRGSYARCALRLACAPRRGATASSASRGPNPEGVRAALGKLYQRNQIKMTETIFRGCLQRARAGVGQVGRPDLGGESHPDETSRDRDRGGMQPPVSERLARELFAAGICYARMRAALLLLLVRLPIQSALTSRRCVALLWRRLYKDGDYAA